MDIKELPNVAHWIETMMARPGVQRGLALGAELRKPMTDEDKKVLFNQRAS